MIVVPAGRNASFVTSGLTPIPGAGLVYHQYRVSGDWGSLEAAEILVSTDRQTLTLPAPFTTDGRTLRTEVLRYSQTRNEVSSDRSFIFDGPGRHIEGEGFTSDPEFRNVTAKRPRGTGGEFTLPNR